MKTFSDINTRAFFELLRAGLWEKEARLSLYNGIDYDVIMQLAEEQAVMGLVTAGLEHIKDVKVPLEVLLEFIGQTLKLEQKNKAMNKFIGVLIGKLKVAGIESVLIKGQGVAQCYERPLWRCSGDVDLLLNDENYERGKAFLKMISETEPEEYSYNKEYITTVGGWCLELHGSLRCGLSSALNREVDDIQREICNNHQVRYWENNGTRIPLPRVYEDVLVIFTHYIKHFYKGGLGIRQICDWCRLLWTYRKTIDVALLEKRLRAMGLINEWKAFAAYAVDYLGMPSDAMPLYSCDTKWVRKAGMIQKFVVKSGNLGHNQDGSYFVKYPFLVRKTISMFRRVGVMFQHASIFPVQTMRYLPYVIYTGVWSAAKGE